MHVFWIVSLVGFGTLIGASVAQTTPPQNVGGPPEGIPLGPDGTPLQQSPEGFPAGPDGTPQQQPQGGIPVGPDGNPLPAQPAEGFQVGPDGTPLRPDGTPFDPNLDPFENGVPSPIGIEDPFDAGTNGIPPPIGGPSVIPSSDNTPDCPEPDTCTSDQILCPIEFPAPGSACPPVLKCLPQLIKGPKGNDCRNNCPTLCTPESKVCDGYLSPDGCRSPGSCVSKEEFCPVYCESDQRRCPAEYDFVARKPKGPDTCVDRLYDGPNGLKCPTVCPTVCGDKDQKCPQKVGPNECKKPDICVSAENDCPDI